MKKGILCFLLVALVVALVPGIHAQANQNECRSFIFASPEKATASDILGNYKPRLALDNDVNTHWFGDPRAPFPKQFIADLGTERCINATELTLFVWDVPALITLEASEDGVTWYALVNETEIVTGGVSQLLTFDQTVGRFIRVSEVSTARQYGSLSELRVQSAAKVPSNATQTLLFEVVDAQTHMRLTNVSYSLHAHNELLEEGMTSQTSKVSFTKLSTEDHELTVRCPVEVQVQSSVLGFLARLFSALTLFSDKARISGYQTGYSQTQGQTIVPSGAGCGTFSLRSPQNAIASSIFEDFIAKRSIDNNPETAWYGDPQDAYPKWVYGDLGESNCVNAVQLQLARLDVPMYLNIEVSEDEGTWTPVVSQAVVIDGAVPVRFDFNTTRARYVRVYETAGERTYGGLAELKVNTASLIQGQSAQLSQHPALILHAESSTGRPLKSVRALLTVTGEDARSLRTDASGNLVFTHALASDAQVKVYCPSNNI